MATEGWDAAIADYTKVIELDPKNGNAYDNRGIAYLKKENFAAALADQNKALEIDPDDISALTGRGDELGRPTPQPKGRRLLYA